MLPAPALLAIGLVLGLIILLPARRLQLAVFRSRAIGVYAAGILIGALSFIPGGLGSTEAAMVVMLSVLGLDLSTALAATIVCRVATLWFAVALGFSAFASIEVGREGSLRPK